MSYGSTRHQTAISIQDKIEELERKNEEYRREIHDLKARILGEQPTLTEGYSTSFHPTNKRGATSDEDSVSKSADYESEEIVTIPTNEVTSRMRDEPTHADLEVECRRLRRELKQYKEKVNAFGLLLFQGNSFSWANLMKLSVESTSICPQSFISSIEKTIGVKFYVGVPDSLLKDFALYVNRYVNPNQHVIAANEGNAVGIAIGHYIATGSIACVYMQNSGLGNAVNPFNSLVNQMIWNIPMLLLIGWRGEPGTVDEPQHAFQGPSTLGLLDLLEIPYSVVSRNPDQLDSDIKNASSVLSTGKPYALVVQRNTFSKFPNAQSPPLSSATKGRVSALRDMLQWLDEGSATFGVVATTGLISREIYSIREERKQSHERDLLTVGGMGHASSVAFGVAINGNFDKVFCFDGDGAIWMHAGSLATIGSKHPHKSQFCHVVLNNGCHESVGGQPTCFESKRVSLKALALACGYEKAWSVDPGSPTFKDVFREFNNYSGSPKLLEVRTVPNIDPTPMRPTISPRQNVTDFAKFIMDKF